jgi:putative FmdB family regulatory protein
MPIFEYLCPACNRIFSFLSLSLQPAREPVCPRCSGTGLTRVPSTFAVSRKREAPPAKSDRHPGGSGPDDAAMARLEHEVMQMASQLDDKDAEDPRVMARMMRRLAEASGETVTPSMEEMFRRMEAGEDPEKLEEELGPLLDEEMGEDDENGGVAAPTRDEGLYDL